MKCQILFSGKNKKNISKCRLLKILPRVKCQILFSGKNKKNISKCRLLKILPRVKCQILFSGKNKKNISKCRLLKILPRVLSVKLSAKLLVFFLIYPQNCVLWILIRAASL